MKIKFLSSLLLLAMFIAACSDQTSNTHVIKGNAFFKDSMEPMGDILLSIYQDNGKERFKLDILGANLITQADGGFQFDIQPFKNSEASDLILSASVHSRIDLAFTQQNFSIPIIFEELDLAEVLEDETYHVDLLGTPYGFFEVELKGRTEVAPGDEIALTVSGKGYKYVTSLTVGEDLTYIYTYPVVGNAKTHIAWETRLSGISSQYSDSVYCTNKEKTRFRIDL